jgi:hypothetical protein
MVHHADARPIVSGSAHGAESSTGHRVDPGKASPRASGGRLPREQSLLWVADVTYLRTSEGWVFDAVVAGDRFVDIVHYLSADDAVAEAGV